MHGLILVELLSLVSIKKLGSQQASSGVTWNFVCRHFTSAKPNDTEQPNQQFWHLGWHQVLGSLWPQQGHFLEQQQVYSY